MWGSFAARSSSCDIRKWSTSIRPLARSGSLTLSVHQRITDTWSSSISLSASFLLLASVVFQLLPLLASPDYTPAGVSTHNTSCFLEMLSLSFIDWKMHWIAQSFFWVWFRIPQCLVVLFSRGLHEFFFQVLFPMWKHVKRCSLALLATLNCPWMCV